MTNPLVFAAGLLFAGGVVYSLWTGDIRIATMSAGLAVANMAIGW